MKDNDVEFGIKGKDEITGFKGVITGHTRYISGCNQVLLCPSVDKDGKAGDSRWFDIQRVNPVKGKKIVLDNEETPGCDIPAPVR